VLMMTAGGWNKTSIRRARSADAPAIASVLRESFAEFRPQYTPEAFAATTPSSEGVLARLREGPVWLAEEEGVIVGTIAAVVESEGLHIRGMAVRPTSRGRGVGHRLLACAEAFARRRGLARLFLSTTPFLTEAIRLYERGGFRSVPSGPCEMFGTPLFTMVRAVSSRGQSSIGEPENSDSER